MRIRIYSRIFHVRIGFQIILFIEQKFCLIAPLDKLAEKSEHFPTSSSLRIATAYACLRATGIRFQIECQFSIWWLFRLY